MSSDKQGMRCDASQIVQEKGKKAICFPQPVHKFSRLLSLTRLVAIKYNKFVVLAVFILFFYLFSPVSLLLSLSLSFFFIILFKLIRLLDVCLMLSLCSTLGACSTAAHHSASQLTDDELCATNYVYKTNFRSNLFHLFYHFLKIFESTVEDCSTHKKNNPTKKYIFRIL